LGTVGQETQYTQLSGGISDGWIYTSGLPLFTGSSIPVDTIAQSSLLRWGNYDVVTGAVRWCGNASDPGWTTTCAGTSEIPTTGITFVNGNPVPSSLTLPGSFYLSSQPSFWKTPFGTPPWPAIGPDVTGGNAPDGVGGYSYSIPAQLCYQNTPIDSTYQHNYTVSGASWSPGTPAIATLTTGSNTLAANDTIRVSGINPSGYNGTWQVTAATSTTVSYALPNNLGTYVSGGVVSSPNILLFNADSCYAVGDGRPAPPTNLTANPQ